MNNQIQSDVKNACLFISEVIENQILPFFNGNNTYSANDLSAVLSQFLIVQNALLAYNQSLDSVLTEVETKIQNFNSNASSSLLFEYVVSANCTSVDIPNLDINTHKSYRIELDFVSLANTSLYLFVNNNLTLSNYYGGRFQSSTAVSGTQYNYPQATYGYLNGYAKCDIDIGLVASKVFCLSACSTFSSPTSSVPSINTFFTSFSVSNLTQLTFVASVANSIGIGSKIRIYRGDV